MWAIRGDLPRVLAAENPLTVLLDDAPAGEIVRRQLDGDPVTGDDTHCSGLQAARYPDQNLLATAQLDCVHGVRQRCGDSSLDGKDIAV